MCRRILYHDDGDDVEFETTWLFLSSDLDLEDFIDVGLVDGEEEPRCKRQRKEPSCLVGEHKHCACPFGNDVVVPATLSLFGDVEIVSCLSSFLA